MSPGIALAYKSCQKFSRVSCVVAIVLISILNLARVELNISVQLIIALSALALGIPHGAVDHLVALPSRPRSRLIIYMGIYVVLAACAVVFIAHWATLGFQLVLIMSGLHFGFGDASFKNEELEYSGKERNSLATEIIFAIPAGFIALLLPLTNSQTTSALARINEDIVNWAGGYSHLLRMATLTTALLSLGCLALLKKFDLALDLLLLLLLGLLTPPLITFAIYFGCWHAIRHTARLIPKLHKAQNLADAHDLWGALRAAVFPGLYALIGTVCTAAILMVFSPTNFSSSLLWSTLVLVWALTVPHMLTTARFDFSALGSAAK